jgi:WD40 repeat protein
MRKAPEVITRKRRAVSPGGSPVENDTPSSKKAKRARKKSKKRQEAEATKHSLFRTPNQPQGDKSVLQLRYTFSRQAGAIVQVDWSADGQYFAGASNAIIGDGEDLRQNRPCNLVHGSLRTKTIRELPEHRIEQETGDPKYVYRTVSAIKFARNRPWMYTGGYDNKLKIWDVEHEDQIACKADLKYKKNNRIEVMDVTGDRTTIVATGTKNGTRSIRVFIGDSELSEASRKEIRPLQEMGLSSFSYSPTCVKFGKEQNQNKLIVGFGEDNSADEPFGDGCLGVWEFTESSCVPMAFAQGDAFVSDCQWSRLGDLFVVGAVSDSKLRKVSWENSVVNLYSLTEQRPVTTFSCKAKDINEVTFNLDMATASCTDGSTYVWDRRNPKLPLHVLTHGLPVDGLQRGIDRELDDVGVRYIEWTGDAGQVYTGGSDGFLKLWDTRRSPADVLVQDVANVGHEILCGKFSPDRSSLLMGDEEGRLHLFDTSTTNLVKDEYKFMVAEHWATPAQSAKL